jgi:D-amino-acid dehydrogenase
VSIQGKVWVIGGGIVGLSVAYALARRQVEVGVIAAGWNEECASFGNAGHIATEQVDTLTDPNLLPTIPSRLFSRGGPVAFPIKDWSTWLPFGLRFLKASNRHAFEKNSALLRSLMADALPAWQRLVYDLNEPQLLIKEGHRVIYESKESAQRGIAQWRNARLGDVTLDELVPSELDEFNEFLKVKIYGGLQFFGSAQVQSPPRVLKTLRAALEKLGVECLTGRVHIKRTINEHFLIHRDQGDPLVCKQLVVAAGAHSKSLLKPLGLKVPIIAERGYHLEGQRGSEWTQRGPVVFEDRNVVVTGFVERLRSTSFVEFAHIDSPPDLRKWQRLDRHINDLGVPMNGPRAPWMGARPTLPDYLPVLGHTRLYPNVWTAFGHQHLGLTLAPVSAELLAQAIIGQTAIGALQGFSIDRFQ